MIKIRTTIFMIFGIIGFLLQMFGLYIILILFGIITKAWIIITIIGIVMTLVDLWKRIYFKKQGYDSHLLGYTKPIKDNNDNIKSS